MFRKIYRNVSSFVYVHRMIKDSQCRLINCVYKACSATHNQNLVQNMPEKDDPTLQVELQLYFPLSDSHGQVDKQISGDAANLPVLTNWKYDGTALLWNMWHVSVKWKVCHTRVCLQRPRLRRQLVLCFALQTQQCHTPGTPRWLWALGWLSSAPCNLKWKNKPSKTPSNLERIFWWWEWGIAENTTVKATVECGKSCQNKEFGGS